MRGGCPRMGGCLYAHTKEELPPQFKCILCRNFQSGHCRKQQICTLAHGEEEQQWFTKFMGEMSGAPGGRVAVQPGNVAKWAPAAPAAPMGALMNAPMGGGAPGPDAMMADNVMMAAESQLMSGKAAPGQLAAKMGGGGMSFPKPTFQPKINMAANPAFKAQQAMSMKAPGHPLQAAQTKGGGGGLGIMAPAPLLGG